MPDRCYKKELYPLQDEALRIIESAATGFYLTGGTALSRAYLAHRYSDDLDFFLNAASDFKGQAQAVITSLQGHFGARLRIGLIEASYVRLFLSLDALVLKLEFVNDVSYHLGEFLKTDLFAKIDSWQNILINKISALGRDEAKDVADLLVLSGRFPFHWRGMIDAAKKKDMWVNELAVSELFYRFEAGRMADLRWIEPFMETESAKRLKVIAEDILHGRENSLAKV